MRTAHGPDGSRRRQDGMTDTDALSDRGSDGRGRKDRAQGSVFSRLALFIRQIVVELRKVIWPTRKELIAYTTVVIAFVLVMAAIIAGLDYVFTKGVLLVFG
jgi:preprotein translocase subunit SecE